LKHIPARNFLFSGIAAGATIVLSSCQTATVSRSLPQYEPTMAKTDFQNVRTTAYTHSESDHTQYGACNALGGALRAAGPAIRRAENRPGIAPELAQTLAYERATTSRAPYQPFSLDSQSRAAPSSRTRGRTRNRVPVSKKPPQIGSAAADWSRWPLGTTFRLLSTGQVYRVEDYGWALSGRNTIDLYMATQRDMNAWGARQEPIQVLKWGDPEESLRILGPRQNYKHIRRMILELQGNEQQAAALQ